MKIIILSVIICSALHGTCQPPYTKNVEYQNWADCMYAGTNDTLSLYQAMGEDYINQHRIFVKFQCKEVEKLPDELKS